MNQTLSLLKKIEFLIFQMRPNAWNRLKNGKEFNVVYFSVNKNKLLENNPYYPEERKMEMMSN